MKNKILLLGLLGCFCLGCGSSRPDPVIIISVVAELPNGELGYTSWQDGEPIRLQIVSYILPDLYLLRHVLAHELIHAATQSSTHIDDETCYAYEFVTVPSQFEPCSIELNWMRAVKGNYRIVVPAEEPCLEATAWAVTLWNEAVGRELFRVE